MVLLQFPKGDISKRIPPDIADQRFGIFPNPVMSVPEKWYLPASEVFKCTTAFSKRYHFSGTDMTSPWLLNFKGTHRKDLSLFLKSQIFDHAVIGIDITLRELPQHHYSLFIEPLSFFLITKQSLLIAWKTTRPPQILMLQLKWRSQSPVSADRVPLYWKPWGYSDYHLDF